jgi:hypothetical protein
MRALPGVDLTPLRRDGPPPGVEWPPQWSQDSAWRCCHTSV